MGNISFNEVLRDIEEEMAQAAKAEQDRQREEEEWERKKNNLYLEQKPKPDGSHTREGSSIMYEVDVNEVIQEMEGDMAQDAQEEQVGQLEDERTEVSFTG
nr:unnamed protein product [Callosobruchus chinensis]